MWGEIMKSSIEIEFKTLLSEEEYNRMIKKFELEDNIFTQENYYFDTDDFYIRNNKLGLRIRHKNNTWKVTMKKPCDDYLCEYSIILSEDEALNYIKNGFSLKEFGYDLLVNFKAKNVTERAIVSYKNGNLFFDKCSYNGIVDYEIEYEADDSNRGIDDFKNFLKDNHITYSPSYHKEERAFRSLGL